MSADVFAALGDPTRRRIVELLVAAGDTTATTLAAELAISRQAVAKHLGVLARAGMAISERVGRETRYQADLVALADVQAWITLVEGEWSRRLQLLAENLES